MVLLDFCDRWDALARQVDALKQRAVAMRKMLGGYKVRLRALKMLERSWWRGGMLPCCPHCRYGLLPEDSAAGACSSVGREYEMARRHAKAGKDLA